ncbi:MAG TPA: ABC transporter permease [Terriglobales bacterium]|nr:ABC transporter permease [Terriglobales bacterium]
MSSLVHDLQYGARQLRRNPGFTATVIVTLALSIGANTAIFSIVNALLLKSLPYSHPERMGTIYTRMRGSRVSDERHHIDGEQWELLRDEVPALISAISNIRPQGVNLEAKSHAQYVRAGRISAHYLDVLSTHPMIGRNFSETEDIPNGPKVAILSYNVWHNTFASDRNILGQTILLKGEPYTVIGVLPQDLMTPLSADVYTAIQGNRDGEGAGTNFECITRLRDGATWQEADAQINHAWGSRPHRYELQDDPSGEISYYSEPLQRGETDPLRPQVLALMLAAGFILLIACANLAGLTLVRVLRRTPEVATRLALGASHWQIQKQLWAENVVLAVAGGAAGIAVGSLALRGLLLLLPEHFLPVADVSLDGRVLAFTVAVSSLTSLLFGMLPALTTRRFDLRSAIGNRQATTGDRLRLRQALIASEVALTIVLLAAAGLLVRNLIHLETLPPGFNPDGVITARASLDNVRYHDAAAFRNLLDESTAAMRRIPGVQAAAVGLGLPYERTVITGGLTVDDGKEAGEKAVSSMAYVTPDYFTALQIPLVFGRYFSSSDGPNTQAVAIINQAFMRKFFHGENPVGRHMWGGVVVVGVVEDVAMAPGIDATAPLMSEQTMYIPATQMAAPMLSRIHLWFQPSWIVRTSRPIEGLTAQMQRALASVDPDLPFSGFYRMQDLLAKTLATERIEVALLGTMAALALILSAVGIFALVANMVTQKTREIGIRMALGSTIREAVVHVGVPGVRALAVGLIVGLALCAGALRVMSSVLYGVGVYDAPAILSAVLVLATVALVAASIPALRIARIDPAQTLREE